MKLIRSLVGRRQFLITFIISFMVLTFIRIVKAFNFIFKDIAARASEISGEKEALKGIVVYFSATGSTGKIAGAIYRGMKTVMDCDVAPIKKINPKDLAKYDVIAIGGPIWYFRETANLRLFIYNMPNMTGKLCIPFCSHGASPSGFFHSLSQPLRKKEFTIIGWNDWFGDVTHVLHMPSPYLTHGHPDDIDLQEAENFGREMAERAKRIYAGERNLIQEVPTGPDADPLWVSRALEVNTGNRSSGATDSSAEIPHIDTSKCIYPRCTACVDNCVVGAIDLSTLSPANWVSGSPIFVKGCVHCAQPMCERSCIYDAITYKQRKTKLVIDLKKCTYPKCTLCVDNCTMNSIDFSHNPPVFHNYCEGCDLCWCICPYGAINITNLAETHMRLVPTRERSFNSILEGLEAKGKFRRLLPIDQVGWDNPVYKNPNAPRVVLHEENYPYHIEKG